MKTKRSLTFIASAVLLVGLLLTSASAWDLEVSGALTWGDEWYDQLGAKGFFGKYNVDKALLGTANMNFWDGGQFDTNFVSGANARITFMHIDFNPVIKVNNAVRLYGHYRLNSWNNPLSSFYVTENAPGLHNAFTEGQWDLFWLAANTPWGVFGLGKRPWSFGIGLQYDGEDSLTTESLTLSAPYGPFNIGLAFYPYRYAGHSKYPPFYQPYGVQPIGDPFDLPMYSNYYSRSDESGSLINDFLFYATYFNGPLEAGALGAYGSFHIGPEGQLLEYGVTPNTNPNPVIPVDVDLFHGSIYQKYNNGRFFLNSELAWLYWTDRFGADTNNKNGPMPPPPGYPTQPSQGPVGQMGANGPIGPLGFPSLPQTRYVEQWRAAIETGLMFGPAKISLFSIWSPGPDRRRGMYIDRQPAAFVRHPSYDIRLGNYSLVVPYSWLFAFNYGSGLNAYNVGGDDGYIRDAFALATRLDYAVAANLNIFGSFFWAERTSDGYERGCLRPVPATPQQGASNGNIDFTRVTPGPYMSQNIHTPNITERSLGYEIDLGINWKLLEGLQFSMVAGYWAPGKWFSYACSDRSDPNWNLNDQPTGGTHDRHIDPVIGGEYNIICNF